jgi:hypothetical protein
MYCILRTASVSSIVHHGCAHAVHSHVKQSSVLKPMLICAGLCSYAHRSIGLRSSVSLHVLAAVAAVRDPRDLHNCCHIDIFNLMCLLPQRQQAAKQALLTDTLRRCWPHTGWLLNALCLCYTVVSCCTLDPCLHDVYLLRATLEKWLPIKLFSIGNEIV